MQFLICNLCNFIIISILHLIAKLKTFYDILHYSWYFLTEIICTESSQINYRKSISIRKKIQTTSLQRRCLYLTHVKILYVWRISISQIRVPCKTSKISVTFFFSFFFEMFVNQPQRQYLLQILQQIFSFWFKVI